MLRESGKPLASLLGIIAVLVFLRLVNPLDSRLLPPCWFHWMTGMHCPGCGTARCLRAIAHGDVAQAAAYNALSLVLLTLLFAWSLARLAEPLIGVRWPRRAPPAWLAWAILACVIAFWIARNVPVHPFTHLAPRALEQFVP